MRLLLLLSGLALGVLAQPVRVEFDPRDPGMGPFPSDFLTMPDSSQLTGRRVNLPKPDCDTRADDCRELDLINQLDGFHLQPRLTIRFSGAINPDTLRDGLLILWLETAYKRPYELGAPGKITTVNQVQWDPATNTAYAKPDEPLEQGRRYALLVTSGIKDWLGQPVAASDGFTTCLAGKIGGDYCAALAAAAGRLNGTAVAGGSVFTTLAATAWMEAAYKATSALPARIDLLTPQALFNVADLQQIIWREQTGATSFTEEALPASPALLAQFGVSRIVFGSFDAPRFADSSGIIQPAGTAEPVLPPRSIETIALHIFLPATPPPPGGYPVLLAAHGLGDSRFGMPSAMAAMFVSKGYAVVAFNAVGHGYGSQSTLRLQTRQGATLNLPAPGRGIDADGDRRIGPYEGCVYYAPGAATGIRDCLRQTALDYMTLVRALRAGVDIDGDGKPDLSGSNLAYFGQSLGAFYGTLVNAIEPAIPAAVLNVGGGSAIETARWSMAFRPLLAAYLGARSPALLNAGFGFEEHYPARYTPTMILTAPRAAAVGEVIDRLEWLEASGAPFAYAPLLRSATPMNNPIKRVLFQFATGDETVPNPANSLLIRAANLREVSSEYRHDLARKVVPSLPENPHAFLAFFDQGIAGQAIMFAGHQQALAFLSGAGDTVPDANAAVRVLFGADLFVTPAVLPETPNFQTR